MKFDGGSALFSFREWVAKEGDLTRSRVRSIQARRIVGIVEAAPGSDHLSTVYGLPVGFKAGDEIAEIRSTESAWVLTQRFNQMTSDLLGI